MTTPRSVFERSRLALPAVFLVLYVVAIAFRPALPVDETRYLTVAWEMLLRHDWLAPLTVNFEPYHHKPPLLFWLINLSWSVFGVSRWAATIPVVLASMASVYLTSALARRLLPEAAGRAQLVMLGCFAFLLYSTVILFDLTLTVFVLGALLGFLAFADDRRYRYALLAGLCLGLGVLTKGPVAYLYVVFPVVFAPYWMRNDGHRKRWYLGSLAALLVSAVPVLLWLVPVLRASSSEFGYWLVWEQTAGRITGSYASSHARPPYFYLLLLPIMLLPWTLLPRFWTGFATVGRGLGEQRGLRFLVVWVVPTLLAFSLIGGKQPHYMVPLLPGIAILAACTMARVSTRALQVLTATMIVVFAGGHFILARTVIDRYDLRPVAEFVAAHPGRDLAFVSGHYRGELSFLARLREPVDAAETDELPAWFDAHPDGMAIVRFERPEEVAGYDVLLERPYRSRKLGIVARPAREGRP